MCCRMRWTARGSRTKIYILWMLNAHFARKNVRRRTNKVGWLPFAYNCDLLAPHTMLLPLLLWMVMMIRQVVVVAFPGELIADAISSCDSRIGNLHSCYAIDESSQFIWIRSLIKCNFVTYARVRAWIARFCWSDKQPHWVAFSGEYFKSFITDACIFSDHHSFIWRHTASSPTSIVCFR